MEFREPNLDSVPVHCVLVIFGAISGQRCNFCYPGEILLIPPLALLVRIIPAATVF